MAHKKAAGSAKNLRDSNPKYRGLKLSWWQFARAWNIIIRQKWDKYVAWLNTYLGKDFTIHAKVDGIVVFSAKNFIRFDGRRYRKTVCSIQVEGEPAVVPVQPMKSAEKKVKKIIPKVNKKVAVKKESIKKTSKTTWSDDLTKIEGIWPKIAELLIAAGIITFADLSGSKIADLRKILADGGSRFAMHDPKTWKKQATLAKNGKRDELKKLQDELDGGK